MLLLLKLSVNSFKIPTLLRIPRMLMFKKMSFFAFASSSVLIGVHDGIMSIKEWLSRTAPPMLVMILVPRSFNSSQSCFGRNHSFLIHTRFISVV